MIIHQQTSVRIPPPQPISSNWKPFNGLRESFGFDDDWRSCSRINGIRSWLRECNAAYSPVSFHHEDDNWRKRLISVGSTELCVDNEREDNATDLEKWSKKMIHKNLQIKIWTEIDEDIGRDDEMIPTLYLVVLWISILLNTQLVRRTKQCTSVSIEVNCCSTEATSIEQNMFVIDWLVSIFIHLSYKNIFHLQLSIFNQ